MIISQCPAGLIKFIDPILSLHMMKNKKSEKNELRVKYNRSDFPAGLVRGKYAKRIKASSNIIVLKPEVPQVFPNEEAVNKALLSLIDLAKKTTHPIKRSAGSRKERVAH
jgi:hypothetical protein